MKKNEELEKIFYEAFLGKEYENLINKADEIIEKYKELKTHYEIICDDLEEHNLIYTDTPEFEDNYIPKSKVKEKIEELKNGTYDAKIILHQLLED